MSIERLPMRHAIDPRAAALLRAQITRAQEATTALDLVFNMLTLQLGLPAGTTLVSVEETAVTVQPPPLDEGLPSPDAAG